ncbi:hypothetical protein TH53_01115 [Pedobacter lusitanus]|uniref:Glycoamylase-like domain-containing protein n=2 Tax=Pedobacter lusitanus TaxID=1503925 RepID=A0A0D0G1R7_9SPHI|nr:hypothetical protein TH53_01115 [Pedobacter lusitanus]
MIKYLRKTAIYILPVLLITGMFSCSKDKGITDTPPSVKKDGAADTLNTLFRNAYRVYEMQRNVKGIYRDSKLFNGTDYHPSSVANIGIGLVSLCVADRMKWIPDGSQQAITTLRTILGWDKTFKLDVNSAGFPRHFVNMETGAREWNSEYSTVDAAIMVSGALFCKNYFSGNPTISGLADSLYKSIDWSKAIADPVTGKLFLTLDADGKGIGTTSVYNEYMLLAHLAYKAENGNTGPATSLWTNFYANPANLPKSNYSGKEVLTDYAGSFLSDFIPQFCYYLCQPYSASPVYMNYMKNSMLADKLWWITAGGTAVYEWGLGAGSDPAGYQANRINDNAGKVVSPHIAGGFIPVNAEAKNDLVSLYRANKGVYTLPGTTDQILWRYSVKDPAWRANEVQGIDYSTMLFGLATLPEHCGKDFFTTYNNYKFPVYSFVSAR